MSAFKQSLLAIISPAPVPHHPGILRSLFKRLPLFGVLSVWMQFRDLKRQARIKTKYLLEDEYFKQVQDCNTEVTLNKVIFTTRRAEELFQVLSVPVKDISKEKVLLIGPRNVYEIVLA